MKITPAEKNHRKFIDRITRLNRSGTQMKKVDALHAALSSIAGFASVQAAKSKMCGHPVEEVMFLKIERDAREALKEKP